MPYIVTTLAPAADGKKGIGTQDISRRAVATLDEAINELDEAMNGAGANGDWRRVAICKLRESGGTVGPLPDGTVVEVERVTLARLREATDLRHPSRTPTEIIAAFNALEQS